MNAVNGFGDVSSLFVILLVSGSSTLRAAFLFRLPAHAVSRATGYWKFVRDKWPRIATTAASYALAASAEDSYVPNHLRVGLVGSLISAAHLPQGLLRTPLKPERLFIPVVVCLKPSKQWSIEMEATLSRFVLIHTVWGESLGVIGPSG